MIRAVHGAAESPNAPRVPRHLRAGTGRPAPGFGRLPGAPALSLGMPRPRWLRPHTLGPEGGSGGWILKPARPGLCSLRNVHLFGGFRTDISGSPTVKRNSILSDFRSVRPKESPETITRGARQKSSSALPTNPLRRTKKSSGFSPGCAVAGAAVPARPLRAAARPSERRCTTTPTTTPRPERRRSPRAAAEGRRPGRTPAFLLRCRRGRCVLLHDPRSAAAPRRRRRWTAAAEGRRPGRTPAFLLRCRRGRCVLLHDPQSAAAPRRRRRRRSAAARPGPPRREGGRAERRRSRSPPLRAAPAPPPGAQELRRLRGEGQAVELGARTSSSQERGVPAKPRPWGTLRALGDVNTEKRKDVFMALILTSVLRQKAGIEDGVVKCITALSGWRDLNK